MSNRRLSRSARTGLGIARTVGLFAVLVLGCLVSFACCVKGRDIRIRNDSSLDFTEVSVAGQRYGDIAAGETSERQSVEPTLGYAALKLRADGRYMTGQTLNLGAKRFTYRIEVEDFDAGHLAIEVVRD